MPRVIVSPTAIAGLERCRTFLAEKEPIAARRAGEAIRRRLGLLREHPLIGRPLPDEPDLRELVIPFGESGYVALYRILPQDDCVVILAFRHQKEAGY